MLELTSEPWELVIISNGQRTFDGECYRVGDSQIYRFFPLANARDACPYIAECLKDYFGFPQLEARLVKCERRFYIIEPLNDHFIPLEQLNYDELTEEQQQELSAWFGFRFCLGLRANTERAIFLDPESGHFHSRENLFPSPSYYQSRRWPIFSLPFSKKWLKGQPPESGVKFFPIWAGCQHSERLAIARELIDQIRSLLAEYHLHYLHAYLRRALFHALETDGRIFDDPH